MQIELVNQTATSKFGFFGNFQNWKTMNKKCWNFLRNFWIFKKRKICKGNLANKYVLNISSQYLEKRLSNSITLFNVKNSHFYAIYGISAFLPSLNFKRFGPLKSVLVSFLVFLTKIWPMAIQNPKMKFDVFDLLTIIWCVIKDFAEYFEVSQTLSVPFHRPCLNLIRLLCTAKPVTKDRNMSFDPTGDQRHQWPRDKFLQIFRNFEPWAIKCRMGTSARVHVRTCRCIST